MSKLPIETVLSPLRETLCQHHRAVLIAPPGAGKTTGVPLALLDVPWLKDKRIIMLEPRRLAARNAAAWMARQLGESVGETVGYRMRLDSKVGEATRIEVVTEGILTRLLQQDPELERYGLVIFDEYHERSLQADLGLALCLDAQGLREDLHLLVMSATLEGEAVSRLLGNAPILHSEGRSHPVEIIYAPPLEREERLEAGVSRAVLHAIEQDSGSILVFLPGQAEIRRVHERLSKSLTETNVSLHPLYGNLSQAEQEQAIRPAGAGQRKVVLATAIAETSLTIEGVRVVIDAGLMRTPRFDPRSGMTRLHTQRLSRASAEQRCGRAGRTAAGVCYRLWDQATQSGLVPHTRAEILDADLAPLALELAQWGIQQPGQLAWLDPPPESAYQQARQLLQSLQALDREGRISPHGSKMLGLGLHPRLAHMLLKGEEMGLGALACECAALLNERDLFRLTGEERQVDLRLRLEALHEPNLQRRYQVDHATLQRVRQSAKELKRRLKCPEDGSENGQAGRLLALAYPDRIAQIRTHRTHYRLSNGKGAMVGELDALADAPFLVAAELDGQQREARIFLAAPLDIDVLEQDFAEQIHWHEEVSWDRDKGMVQACRQRRLGQLLLAETPLDKPPPGLTQEALLEGIRQMGLACLPWDQESRQWQQRVLFLRRSFPHQDWPDISDASLLEKLDSWLAPYLDHMSKLSQLKGLPLKNILNNRLSWEQQQALARLAPSHLEVPSGSHIAIDYQDDIPVLAVRLQELFGLNDTPTIADGKVALLLHLLSPARRPIQVTRDLKSFWQNTYEQVKKDLKGRYPKHYWPDDPLHAQATHRAKPRES